MSWLTVVNVFALIGAASVVVSGAVLVVGLLLTRNADAPNRHSSHR